MPGLTKSDYANALRRVYKPFIQKTFTSRRVLRSKMKPRVEQMAEGERISFTLHTQPSGAITTGSSIYFPDAEKQVHERAFTNYKYTYARVMVTGPAIAASSRKYAAEARALFNELQGIAKDIRYLDQRQLWIGSSGQLATMTAVGSSTSITVTAAKLRYLRIGDTIDILKTADGQPGSGGRKLKITNIAPSTNVVTLSGGSTGTGVNDATDLNTNVANYGVYWQNSYLAWPWGVQDVVSASDPTAGSYCGIARSGNNWWQGQTQAGGGDMLALQEIQELIDLIMFYGTDDPGQIMLVCDPDTWNYIGGSLVDDRRFRGKELKLEGWFNALDFAGTPIVKDYHCPALKLYALDLSTWFEWQDVTWGKGGWRDEESGDMLTPVEEMDAYQAVWKRYHQTVCVQPNANGYLDGFTLS